MAADWDFTRIHAKSVPVLANSTPTRAATHLAGARIILVAGASDVIQTLKGSTADQLTVLLASNPDRLRINRSRGALQLIGCWNQVVASYSANSIPALEVLIP
jgi:beta-phosphoglucomutase-like phosphatase (HAD superfamily)